MFRRARARSSISFPVRVSGVPTAADFGAGAPTRRRSASVALRRCSRSQSTLQRFAARSTCALNAPHDAGNLNHRGLDGLTSNRSRYERHCRSFVVTRSCLF